MHDNFIFMLCLYIYGWCLYHYVWWLYHVWWLYLYVWWLYLYVMFISLCLVFISLSLVIMSLCGVYISVWCNIIMLSYYIFMFLFITVWCLPADTGSDWWGWCSNLSTARLWLGWRWRLQGAVQTIEGQYCTVQQHCDVTLYEQCWVHVLAWLLVQMWSQEKHFKTIVNMLTELLHTLSRVWETDEIPADCRKEYLMKLPKKYWLVY